MTNISMDYINFVVCKKYLVLEVIVKEYIFTTNMVFYH